MDALSPKSLSHLHFLPASSEASSANPQDKLASYPDSFVGKEQSPATFDMLNQKAWGSDEDQKFLANTIRNSISDGFLIRTSDKAEGAPGAVYGHRVPMPLQGAADLRVRVSLNEQQMMDIIAAAIRMPDGKIIYLDLTGMKPEAVHPDVAKRAVRAAVSLPVQGSASQPSSTGASFLPADGSPGAYTSSDHVTGGGSPSRQQGSVQPENRPAHPAGNASSGPADTKLNSNASEEEIKTFFRDLGPGWNTEDAIRVIRQKGVARSQWDLREFFREARGVEKLQRNNNPLNDDQIKDFYLSLGRGYGSDLAKKTLRKAGFSASTSRAERLYRETWDIKKRSYNKK